VSLRAWRTAYASAAGTSHARRGAACQDAGRCDVVQATDGSEVLVASVSDGAGSAPRSEQGARLAVESFQRVFGERAREQPGLGFLDEDCARTWLASLQADIAAIAEVEGLPARDYACTFLGAVIGPAAAAFLQIGDGAIVVADGRDDDEHRWITWPQHGEFANSTFFVTMEEAGQMLAFTRRETDDARTPIRELVMFSDGLERLILDMRGRTVHSPSVRPILTWLAGTEPPGGVSDVLASYLDSANVNRRTDDDKTLVVATRAEAAP
jgi:hypothetical protein